MLTMGIDIGSRSAQCVILEDGQLLTYGNIETGPESAKTAYAAVDAAVHRRCELWGKNRMQMPDIKTDHLRIEDMACIIGTGYGRAVVPFAHGTVTEISDYLRLLFATVGVTTRPATTSAARPIPPIIRAKRMKPPWLS